MKQEKFLVTSNLTILLVWLLGLLAFVYNYIIAHHNYDFSFNLFWISLITCCFSCFLGVIKPNQKPWQRLSFIFLFSLPFSLVNYLRQPDKFIIPDEIFHYQYFRMICETGTLNQPFLTFEIPKYYPGLEILSASVRLIVGDFMSVIPFLKLFSIIIHSLIIVFLFLLYSGILKSKLIGAIAVMVYVTNPYFTLFDSRFSYQTLGVVFICLLLLILRNDNKSMIFRILAILVLCALIITHHWSSYIFIFIMILVALEQLIIKKEKTSWSFSILSMVIAISWIIYLAIDVANYYSLNIGKAITELFLLIERENPPKVLLDFDLPIYEVIVDKILYFPTLFVMYIIGFLAFRDKFKEKYVFSLLGLGSLFFVATPLLLTSDSGRYAMRTWSFAFIGLALFIAVAIQLILNHKEKIKNKAGISIILIYVTIIIVVGGMSIGQNPLTRIPNNPNCPLYSTGTTAYTDSFINAGIWIKNNFNNRKKIIGDLTIKYMIGGYSNLFVDVYYDASTVILSDEIKKSQKLILKNYDIIAINKLLEKYPIYRGDIKDSKISKIVGPHVVPFYKLNKFDNYSYFIRNYDNGKSILYRIGEIL